MNAYLFISAFLTNAIIFLSLLSTFYEYYIIVILLGPKLLCHNISRSSLYYRHKERVIMPFSRQVLLMPNTNKGKYEMQQIPRNQLEEPLGCDTFPNHKCLQIKDETLNSCLRWHKSSIVWNLEITSHVNHWCCQTKTFKCRSPCQQKLANISLIHWKYTGVKLSTHVLSYELFYKYSATDYRSGIYLSSWLSMYTLMNPFITSMKFVYYQAEQKNALEVMYRYCKIVVNIRYLF